METSFISTLDSLKNRIDFYCDAFEVYENKVEGLYCIKKILILLKKCKDLDPRIEEFLNNVQKELRFDIENIKPENFYIFCPKIEFNETVSFYLEKEKQFKSLDFKGLKIEKSSERSLWDYIVEEVISMVEKHKKPLYQILASA